MGLLCNNTALWDLDLTWNHSWPQFTQCFQETVLTWVPCGWLWVTAPFYLYYLSNLPSGNLTSFWKCYFQTLLCGFLIFINLILMIGYAAAADALQFEAHFIAHIVEGITIVFALVLIRLERRKGLITSGVLWMFWFLLTITGIITFYSRIILKEYNDNLTEFTLFYLRYAMILIELIMASFAETPEDKQSNKVPCPEIKASFLSRLTFFWMLRLLLKGYKTPLKEGVVFDLNPRDTSSNNMPRFLFNWQKELAQRVKPTQISNGSVNRLYSNNMKLTTDINDERTPLVPKTSTIQEETTKPHQKPKLSIVRALWRTLWIPLCKAHIWKVFFDFLFFTNPLLLGQVINFVEDKSAPIWKGYTLAAIMFCSILCQSLCMHATWHFSTSLALRARAIIISAIYRKALTINNQARRESTVGEIVNLMSVDCEHIKNMIMWAWGLWSSVLQIGLSLYFLYTTLGLPMLAGFGIIVVIMPVNYIIVHLWNKTQIKIMALKDLRMKTINEVLNGMKILKLYGWEESFQNRIIDIRSKEIRHLWHISILEALILFTWTLTPYFVNLATLATYLYTTADHYLSPETAFVAVALLNNLKFAVVALPELIADSVQGYVSMQRITKFLNNEDLNKANVQWNPTQDEAVKIDNATFSWNKEDTPTLKNISLSVRPGELIAIVGQVGAGKSSLMTAMFGEMDKMKGNVTVKGRLAYVPQQAWIQNDTLQNNILFGKIMDQECYNRVLHCCALMPDIEILPGGDKTEIGERGVNVSGGQKQRVSLARAVYNNADIYLLDDPLSAVDSHVGKHIFENLICDKGWLRKKTRILVTHGIHWLPRVDRIIVMVDGSISETGSYEELLSHNGPFAQFLQTYLLEHQGEKEDDPEEAEFKRQVIKRLESVTSDEERDDRLFSANILASVIERSQEKKVEDEPLTKAERLVEEEEIEEGKVQMGVYRIYASAVGPIIWLICISVYAVYQTGSVVSNLWLSQWTDNERLANLTVLPSNSSERMSLNNYYVGVYGSFGIIQAAGILIYAFLWGFRSVHASKILHNGMLVNLMKAPMSFFDTTPSGRIVNRFSQDIDAIDLRIPHVINMCLNCAFMVLSCIIMISYSTPVFLAVLLPLGVLYYFIRTFYVASCRQLQRLESRTRSPIYSHFGESISGNSVIRAFKVQDRFIRQSELKVDENQKYAFYMFSSQRWLGFNLETLGNLVIAAAAILAVTSRNSLSGGIVGLSISYALQITNNLNWLVRMASDLETQIVSVERVKQYTDVSQEAAWILPECRPDSRWPQCGIVKFQDYSTRYREGLDLVLKGISFTVHPGEKVGIVGRTGAGKSSLTLSLFRLIEAVGGEINIDGIDISSMGLHDLRKKLTILPQDPVLFAGSLRSNVDPFDDYGDPEIWTALEHAHLKTHVQSLSGLLEHECSEGGENMSVGQRQLLCLARALLRKTKILILDEATAAVDMETDDLIQQTIKSEFAECTVLTIAHRLHTVMDYDKILVLDNGKIAEFDSPSSLLQRTSSQFYKMCKSAGLVS